MFTNKLKFIFIVIVTIIMSTLYKCRLCLKLVRNKIPIFKDDFPKMIELLSGLKVDPNDDLPKTSCLDCANNVKIALKTKKLIIQSHKILLEEILTKYKDDYIPTIPIAKNINEENVMEKGTIESNKIKREPDKIAKSIDTNPTNCGVGSHVGVIHKLTEKRLKSYTTDSAMITSKNTFVANPEPSVLIEKSKSEVLTFNHNVKKNCSIKPVSDGYESDEEPASSMSDPISDADWTPEKEGAEQIIIETNKPRRKTRKKPVLKTLNEVFFVRKRNTSVAKKIKKTGDTVIRIKKKPKERKPATRVTCTICKKEVKSNWFSKHMETHEYNPTTCEFCGLISKSATALRHHVYYYHRSSADEYICDQCGRCFRSKYRLDLHKKKEHGGTKDFECTICGKKFFERMHLKRHVDKTHKNIRPYVCDFCGKTFKSRNHIKIHERIHSKEAPYICHMCGECFKMKLTLRTHLRSVHKVQEVQKVFCDICKRGFASDVALKAHVNSRIHETEKCQYCSEMFTRNYMVNHLRDVHEIKPSTIN